MFPLLNTERLRLREIHESDAEALFQCLSKDEVTRFYGQDSLENVEQAKDIVASFAKNHREKRAIRWGIERKDTQELIGTIVFMPTVPNTDERKSVMKSILHIGAKDLCQKRLKKLSLTVSTTLI
jgi:RimJ/RimL family protein N-acetyltransferase